MITLYRKNSFGIGRWCIWHEAENEIRFGHSVSISGPLSIKTEIVEGGKAGRSLEEQIKSRIDSRVSKMLDKGYKFSSDEAAEAVTNQLGLITPMLAKPLKTQRVANAFIQPKLNGHRCLITNVDGNIVAYTRQGKLIDTMQHITRHFEDLLPMNATIDGELYIHEEKLQTIASLVKRKQKRSVEVVYHAYDYIVHDDMDTPFIDRYKILQLLCRNIDGPVAITETVSVKDLNQAMDIYKLYVQAGYEGAIVRDQNGKYENGKRSSGLLKIKPLFDTEVEVVDIERSETGFALCVCRMDGLDKVFKTLAPGTHVEKYRVLENKDEYIGRRLKIEYRELTSDKVPFHAVATEWFHHI